MSDVLGPIVVHDARAKRWPSQSPVETNGRQYNFEKDGHFSVARTTRNWSTVHYKRSKHTNAFLWSVAHEMAIFLKPLYHETGSNAFLLHSYSLKESIMVHLL